MVHHCDGTMQSCLTISVYKMNVCAMFNKTVYYVQIVAVTCNYQRGKFVIGECINISTICD